MAPSPPEPLLEERPFPGTGDPASLLPPRTRELAPFLDALAERRLILQACDACGRLRYPVAPVCPHCRAREWSWRACSGAGSVHSWVRYRRGYLPEFESLMPYVVVCVGLDEGPTIFGRLAAEPDGPDPSIGMRVQAIVERLAGGECVPAFVALNGP